MPEYFSELIKNSRFSPFDEKFHQKKAEKIILILVEELNEKTKEAKCLDIGCSSGIITNYLADYFQKVIGVDIDEKALMFARKKYHKNNLEFKNLDVLKKPLPNESFDVIICNQIYEHVDNANLLINNIYHMLKPGGICFFGAANKIAALFECHYQGLPFVAWMPKKIADLMVKVFRGKESYDVKFLSYFTLRKLVKDFILKDYTFEIIKNPGKYKAEDVIKNKSFFTKIPLFILKFFTPLIPSYVWILKKKPNKQTWKS